MFAFSKSCIVWDTRALQQQQRTRYVAGTSAIKPLSIRKRDKRLRNFRAAYRRLRALMKRFSLSRMSRLFQQSWATDKRAYAMRRCRPSPADSISRFNFLPPSKTARIGDYRVTAQSLQLVRGPCPSGRHLPDRVDSCGRSYGLNVNDVRSHRLTCING